MSQEKPTPQNNDEPTVRRFRKKPVEIEAVQWDGSRASIQRACDWVNGFDPTGDPILTYEFYGADDVSGQPLVETLEGDMAVSPGDWIIRGVKGEFYPCKPDVFEATYDAAELGVTKGLPGIAAEAGIRALKQLTAGMKFPPPPEPDRVLAYPTWGLEHLAPGATQAAQTGMEIANRTIGYVGQDSAAAVAAALELIGKQTDVVAVQLPEPDANIANPTWIIDEPGFGTQVRVNRDSIDGCVRWGPVRFEDTAEVREFAAALLAAANVADAAEDGAQ